MSDMIETPLAVQDSPFKHKAQHLPERGVTVVITEIDDSLLSGDAMQEVLLSAMIPGIVKAYLNANQAQIIAAIDPNFVMRVAQAQVAAEVCGTLRQIVGQKES